MTNDTQAVSRRIILLGSRPHADTRRAGFLLVTAAAIAFSTAGLFTRLIASDVWTILFWRGLFGGLLIVGYVVWRYRVATLRTFVSIGWVGLLAAVCSIVATICFITALRQTTVADVTVIYATAPFIAALIAWMWTRERQSRITLAASGLALLGVVVMFGAALSMGQVVGDLLALVMTVLMALMMVIVRQNRQVSMLPAACLSAFACALAVMPLAHPGDVTLQDLTLLALFGTTQFGLGFTSLDNGQSLDIGDPGLAADQFGAAICPAVGLAGIRRTAVRTHLRRRKHRLRCRVVRLRRRSRAITSIATARLGRHS